MFHQYRLGRVSRLAALLLLHAQSIAFSPTLGNIRLQTSRHSSILPPLHYLSDDELDETNIRPEPDTPKKKPHRSFLHQLDRLLTEFQMTQYHLQYHPHLSGNYAPVDKENFEVEVEVVEGQIPKVIWGAFCRNGPNPKREWQRKRYHWFDGREYDVLECTDLLLILCISNVDSLVALINMKMQCW